jgi:hypothetical protein
MAGEWIKFECSLPEKPETLAITSAMGWTDPDLTVGKLMRLFRWFDQQTVDGNAARVTPALLDHVIGVPGLTLAVASVGWISVTHEGLALAKFDRHNGNSAKQRALTAKRVAKHKSNADANDEGNAASVSDALARGEERREESSSSSSLRSEEEDGGARPSPGEACKAMKAAGMASVSPSSPDLIALLDAGITLAELVDATKYAVEKQKPFSYALKTAEGRRRDAARIAPLPAANTLNKQEALEASNRAVADRFLAKEGLNVAH